jgi:TPR repeat protein
MPEYTEEKLAEIRVKAKQGDPEALCQLATHCIEEGNNEEAKKCFLKAAAQGVSIAPFNLGVLLLEEGNKEEAEKCFKAAANKGFAKAQFNLGLMYKLGDTGNGMADKERLELAEKWLKAAANQGHLKAQFQLGLLLEKSNKKESHNLYRQAAEGGPKDAVSSLIKAHESKKAHKADLAELKQKLEQMNQTPEEREAAEAKAVEKATKTASKLAEAAAKNRKSKTPSPELDGAAAAPPKRSFWDKMAELKAKGKGGYKPLISQGGGGDYGSFGK